MSGASRMTTNFDIIETGVAELKSDFSNGSRVLATKALQSLHDSIEAPEHTSSDKEELWKTMRIGAYQLCEARPSMSAAVTSALLQALSVVRKSARPPKQVLAEEIAKRQGTGQKIAQHFIELIEHHVATTPRESGSPIRILTLSLSSTLRQCLFNAIRTLRSLQFNIRILESRPNCEGADFAVSLVKEFITEVSNHRVTIEVGADAYMCFFAKDIDLLLLGADRISAEGDVSNKTGSFASALCVKALSPQGKVVVVSDSDKIAAFDTEDLNSHESGPSEEVTSKWKADTKIAAEEQESDSALVVHNTYFEWISASFIDFYSTEQGSMNRDQIKQQSHEIQKLKNDLFDAEIRSLARE